MKRLVCTAALLLLMPLPGGAGGSNYRVPDIHKCGRIDRKRKPPAYELTNALLRGSREEREGKDTYRYYVITMKFRDYGEMVLHKYRAKGPSWDCMCGRDVATGWLEGARDLLLICWADGRGRYPSRYYLIARVVKGKATPLLKHCGQTAMNARSGDYHNGLEYFHYSYDPKRKSLVNRMSLYRQVRAFKPGPLLHATKDPDDGETIYEAALDETVLHRYRYRKGRLSSVSLELIYETQKRESPKDIARFYLGPLAPRSAILEANPKLKAKHGGKSRGVIIYLPAKTKVKIPVPEAWLKAHYHGYEWIKRRK